MEKRHFTHFLLLISFGAMLGSCGKGDAAPAAAIPNVMLIATGNVNGELEPCG